ncbi:MAG: dinitrogenase iron-molybdenum cofactor biosynthesis protein [Candidatus Omnitrophica bacterium]|nr:dinitrogenase iron-molybdenum cofactor biosynthesis protein [Candidatus Omnitrophota bacterium]
MKICVTSEGSSADAAIDPRFGRCAYFAIADTETGEIEFLPNGNRDGMGGVGVRSGQLMAEKGVKAVLTGNVGPNAFDTLKAGGISVYTGLSGKVSEAVEKFTRGGLETGEGPSVDPHHGMK